jgi:tungstate transport system substrate-binding protein
VVAAVVVMRRPTLVLLWPMTKGDVRIPTPRRTCPRLLAALAVIGAIASPSRVAEGNFIIVQSTTSTEQAGPFGHLLPLVKGKTGIEVRVVAVGTGQAIKDARNGDGDVLPVHSRPDEENFVAPNVPAQS